MSPLVRVLYAEDEPDIRAIAALALETVGGLTLLACSSGDEAVAAAASFAPDLVLLDVMMPGMDGPSALRALRQLPATARTPVVFMTAKAQPAELAAYRALGAAEVIVKPFDPLTLAEELRAIWRRLHGH